MALKLANYLRQPYMSIDTGGYHKICVLRITMLHADMETSTLLPRVLSLANIAAKLLQ